VPTVSIGMKARAFGTFLGRALVGVALTFACSAGAGGTNDTQARLEHGETVTYTQTIEGDTHRSVGGVTYTVVEASPAEMQTLLEDVNAYRQVLPRTKSARLVGVNGRDFFVELRQGNAIVDTSYTIRLRREQGGRTVRFWLDPSKPHGIADAWGFFRLEPLPEKQPGVPRTLLTYGAMVDVGPGLVRELFEERVRAAMLQVPQLVRRYAALRFRGRNAA
jgi:hypothetical protein